MQWPHQSPLYHWQAADLHQHHHHYHNHYNCNCYQHHYYHHHCGVSGVCNGPPPYHKPATRARVSTDQKITNQYKRSPNNIKDHQPFFVIKLITNHRNFRILLKQLIKSVLQPPFNQPPLFFHQSQASTSQDQF